MKTKEIIREEPLAAGEVFDEQQRLIGRYVYLQEGDQEKLDSFFSSWLETYEKNENFHCVLDLETQGLLPHEGQILLVSMSWDGKNSIIFQPDLFDLTLFKEVLNTIPLSNQNIKFDLKWLSYHYGTKSKIFIDTMVCTQMGWAGSFPFVPNGQYSLGNIAKQLLNGYVLEKETRNEFIGMDPKDGFTKKQIEYAVKDSLITYKLIYPIFKRLQNQNLWQLWEEVERPLIELFVEVELRGIRIDVETVKELLHKKKTERDEIHKELISEVELLVELQPSLRNSLKGGDFKPSSPKQVVDVLMAAGIKTTSTAKDKLEALRIIHPHKPIIGLLLEWKKLNGVITKFLNQWLEKHIDPRTGLIHASFKTYGAETGRLACSEPNMMQVKAELRSMIIAREGYKLASIDFSQYELKAAAGLTEEPYLMKAYKERAELLPQVEALAGRYGEKDADNFCKKAKDLELTTEERSLVARFLDTDVHRRNAALIFNKNTSEVTVPERSIAKCVDLSSHVFTNKGLFTLRELLPKRLKKDTYYPCDLKILTDDGYKDCPQLYYYGKSKALKIETATGMKIICSKVHQFRSFNQKDVYSWVKAEKLKVGQDLIIKLGAPYEGTIPKVLHMKKLEELIPFFELVGLIQSKAVVVDNSIIFPDSYDEKVRDLLKRSNFGKVRITGPTKRDAFIHVFLDSLIPFANETAPPALMHNCHEDLIINYLIGLSKVGNSGVKFSSSNEQFLRQIRNLLLRLGIHSWFIPKKHNIEGVPSLAPRGIYQEILNSKFNNSESPKKTELSLLKSYSSAKTKEKILDAGYYGSTTNDITLVKSLLSDQQLKNVEFLMSNGLKRETIVSITEVEAELGDLSVPENHTVVYEGFVSHNTLNYALLYGGEANRIQTSLGQEGYIYTLDECKAFVETFFDALPKMKEFIKMTHGKVLNPGYVETPQGRKRFFSLCPRYITRMYEKQLEESKREAVNYMFQASNADATKRAMVLLYSLFKVFPEEVRPHIVNSIHDELLFEIHESNLENVIEIAKTIMIKCGSEAINNSAPIEVSVSVGDRWSH